MTSSQQVDICLKIQSSELREMRIRLDHWLLELLLIGNWCKFSDFCGFQQKFFRVLIQNLKFSSKSSLKIIKKQKNLTMAEFLSFLGHHWKVRPPIEIERFSWFSNVLDLIFCDKTRFYLIFTKNWKKKGVSVKNVNFFEVSDSFSLVLLKNSNIWPV